MLVEAPQRIYLNGVPHTDHAGAPRRHFEQGVSFFPIGLYHALVGEWNGREYGLANVAEAGFNLAFPWPALPVASALEAAEDAKIQLVLHDPPDALLPALGAHPRVLGFDVDHEPSFSDLGPDDEMRLDRFAVRRARIRAAAGGKPVFTVDSPSVTPPRRARWISWKRAGDVAAFWKYPFAAPATETLSGPRGLPEVTRLAVEAVDEAKPVWHVAQAFRSPILDWRMPRRDEARAMVVAALVHGATGIVWFALDSFVTRNGEVIGMAPDPASDYGVRLEDPSGGRAPLSADAAARAESRRMWRDVTALNRELSALADVVLKPTADIAYTVEVRGSPVSETPIRAMLKRDGDELVLIAVNIDAMPLDVRFSLAGEIVFRGALLGPPPAFDRAPFERRLDAFGVVAWRLAVPARPAEVDGR